MPAPARTASPSRILALSMAAYLMAMAYPGALRSQDAQSRQQAEARKKLTDVHSRVEALSKQQATTAAQRERLNADLAKQAAALAEAARAVRETEAALAAKRHDLEQLKAQYDALDGRLHDQRAAIAELLRATYAMGRGSDLRLLLGDQDLAQISRSLAYSKYFQQDRARRIQQLMTDLARLKDLQDAIAAEQQALQATRERREKQARTLARQRAAQQKLAAEADAQYRSQGERLAGLKQNEQSLNALVDKLQKAIDAAAREAEREAAREAARQRQHPGRHGASTPAVGSAAANIRGNLPWPASGSVNTYGNGVLIKAPGGSEVHAVARGRVVYAAFLRGYGMLIIVNHGNGWMSMYGNNESVLHKVGDPVEAGQAIGTASPVIGASSGVYFELRQGGKPVDPRGWLSRR